MVKWKRKGKEKKERKKGGAHKKEEERGVDGGSGGLALAKANKERKKESEW